MAARTALRLLLWAALSGAVAQAPTAAVTATAGPSCSDSLFTYEHPPFALPAMSLRLSVALCEGDVVEDVVAAAFADAPVNVELDAQLIASVVDGVRNALAAGHADVATLSAVHVVRRPAPSGVEVPAGVEVRTPSNLHKWRDTYARDGVERVQREALYGDDFSYRCVCAARAASCPALPGLTHRMRATGRRRRTLKAARSSRTGGAGAAPSGASCHRGRCTAASTAPHTRC